MKLEKKTEIANSCLHEIWRNFQEIEGTGTISARNNVFLKNASFSCLLGIFTKKWQHAANAEKKEKEKNP